MKLLHIIDTTNPASGGPIEAVKQFAVALQGQGHTVDVACTDDPAAPWLEELPFGVHPLGPPLSNYGYAPNLREWLGAHATDYGAVVIDGIWQYHGFAAHRVLRRLGVPYSVFTHGMLDPWFKERYPLKHLKKRLYWRFGEYPVLRDAQSVLFTCAEEAELAVQSFKPSSWRSRIVNLGTSGPTGDSCQEKQAFLARFPQLADSRIILFFGRLAEKKGVDLLIAAFAQVAEKDDKLQLVLAGPVEPKLDNELRLLAGSLGVSDRITWTGMLLGAERWGAYRAAEVFVLASHQENFGISVVEALSCGLPVLISNRVNIWREIESGKAGYVESDTVDGARNLLTKWLGLTAAEKQAMATRANALFLAKFEIHEAAKAMLSAVTTPLEGASSS